MTGRRAAASALVALPLALVLVWGPPAAAAGPNPVDPSRAATFPVEEIRSDVQELYLPDASLDGGVVASAPDELTLASDVLFDYNSADLNAAAARALPEALDRLRARGARSVRVVGHTDSDGADEANLALSQRRARTVASALTAALPALAVASDGLGETRPVATNETPEGRALNRRVTIEVVG